MAATATIHTYTVIRTPPEGFTGAPYCIAIGDPVTPLAIPDAHGATYTL